MYFVYILWSDKACKYYIGHTSDIEERIMRHNAGREKSTKPYLPWKLLLKIQKETKSEAIIFERKLKNLNTSRLQIFIDKYS